MKPVQIELDLCDFGARNATVHGKLSGPSWNVKCQITHVWVFMLGEFRDVKDELTAEAMEFVRSHFKSARLEEYQMPAEPDGMALAKAHKESEGA